MGISSVSSIRHSQVLEHAETVKKLSEQEEKVQELQTERASLMASRNEGYTRKVIPPMHAQPYWSASDKSVTIQVGLRSAVKYMCLYKAK